MNALYTEYEREIVRVTRSFVDKEIRPYIDQWENEDRFPLHLLREIGKLGGFGAVFQEQWGGTDLGIVSQMLIIEELSRGSGGIGTTVLVQLLALNPIAQHGTEDQKQNYLMPGILGEKAGAIAVTEPNHGSNVAGMETKAVKDGDHYVINGTKMFITNGTFADFVVVGAKTDSASGRKGISLFLVEKGTPGFQIGKKLKKLGWHTSETAELIFENCKVPKSSLIGEEGKGFYYIMEDFNLERLLLSAEAIGLATEALELAIQYAKERAQFDKPIYEHQAVRHKLASMATKIEAARQLSYQAARLVDRGFPSIKEVSMAKFFSSEMVNRVCYDAIQIFGGYGFMSDYPVQRLYRDARVLTIGGGTSEIQKEIIAKQLFNSK